MIIRILEGKEVKEQVVDDKYLTKTILGFQNAIKDMGILIDSNLDEYLDKFIVRKSFEIFGNTEKVTERIKTQLCNLSDYINNIVIENNILEIRSSFIRYGLSAITYVYCDYKLMEQHDIENHDLEMLLNKFRKQKYGIWR